MVPPQLNSRLGFIIPGLTLTLYCMVPNPPSSYCRLSTDLESWYRYCFEAVGGKEGARPECRGQKSTAMPIGIESRRTGISRGLTCS